MKKSIAIILVIILIIVIGLGAMYMIDMNRMDNNLPVVFSTWGYDYAPPIDDSSIKYLSSGENEFGKSKTSLEELPKDYTREMAIENGDIVISHDGIMKNDQIFRNFKDNFSNGKKDSMRIVTYTIEGDPIITEYNYDDNMLEVREDSTRDNFGLSTEIVEKTYNVEGYNFIDKIENDSDWHMIYLVKQSSSVEAWQSQSLKIEDEIYICSYKEYESSVVCGEELHSFIGTIVEEKDNYIIVEPNEDEYERKSADRIIIPIKDVKRDYIYGEGRKVLIKYTGNIEEIYPAQINNATIDVNGYSDFEILVVKGENIFSSRRGLKAIDSLESDRSLYITGFEKVDVKIGEEIYDFNSALESGKITANGLLAKANKDNEEGLNEKLTYKDGGTTIWRYEDYAILKMNTVEGDNDILIGPKDLSIDTLNKLREVIANGGGKIK